MRAVFRLFDVVLVLMTMLMPVPVPVSMSVSMPMSVPMTMAMRTMDVTKLVIVFMVVPHESMVQHNLAELVPRYHRQVQQHLRVLFVFFVKVVELLVVIQTPIDLVAGIPVHDILFVRV